MATTGPTRSSLFRTKSVEQSIADTDEPETKLRKDLTAWDLTVFGVAVVIGAGIFTLTARTAGNVAGPSVSLAFVLAAITCALAALCYAEFASTVPVASRTVKTAMISTAPQSKSMPPISTVPEIFPVTSPR